MQMHPFLAAVNHAKVVGSHGTSEGTALERHRSSSLSEKLEDAFLGHL
jgi:hypothetical protein